MAAKRIENIYKEEIPVKEQRKLRAEFCERFQVDERHFYHIIKKPVESLSVARLQFFANYFTEGSVDALIALCSSCQVPHVQPQKPKKL